MLNIAWFMKYAPTKFDEFIFEKEEHKQYVSKWTENKYIDGNILLHGPAGVGKTVFSELLIKNLISNSYDFKRIKSRSVTEIDELYSWCQKKPLEALKKIVYIEEVDKLSTTAISTLKDTILEKFQEFVTFICTTNYLNSIEYPVRTRFNYILNFNGNNIPDIQTRLEYILNNEKITYDKDKLKQFVLKNYSVGYRTLITKIQCNSISGILNLENKTEVQSLEETIVNNTLEIIKILFSIKKLDEKKLVMVNPLNSVIANQYSAIAETSQFNSDDIDWIGVFVLLNKNIRFLPIKNLINRYMEELDKKRLLYLHYESFVYECIKTIMEINI